MGNHIAITYKNKRLKVYVDQFRVLSMPDFGVSPKSIALKQMYSEWVQSLLQLTNCQQGEDEDAGEEVYGHENRDKAVSNLDVDKRATIKPRRRVHGSWRVIVGRLKNNPDIIRYLKGTLILLVRSS